MSHRRYSLGSYEEMREGHRWEVPERYNIAVDVCDKHPRDKLAMVWEDWRGNDREVSFGELQDLSNRFAGALEVHGIERGDRVATLLPSLPETAAVFLGTYKRGAILLSMSVLYGDDGIQHRLRDSGAKALVTDTANRHRIPDRHGRSDLHHRLARGRRRAPGRRHRPDGSPRRRLGLVRRGRHRRRRSCAALLLLRHDRPGQGHPSRAPLPARPRGVRVLPRRAGRRAVPRHGRVGVGGRHRSAAGPLALRRHGPRVRAQGRLRSRGAARVPVEEGGTGNVHHPHCAARDDRDQGRRGAVPPAAAAQSLLRGRAAQPGGHPLVSRAVRPHGARLLRAHGELSAVRQLPHGRGARGFDGASHARLGRGDPRRGREAPAGRRARGDLPAREVEPPLSDRLLEPAGRHRRGVRRRLVPHQGRRRDGRGRVRLVRGPRRRRDHLRGLPDRAVRGGVGVRGAPRGAGGRRRRITRSQARRHRQGVRGAVGGPEPTDATASEIKSFVRGHLSAYAYPREIEFVDDLPKTLTGKIRRIELREAEREKKKQASAS